MTDQKTELAPSVSRTGLDDRGSRTTLPIIASSKAPTAMNTVVIIGPSLFRFRVSDQSQSCTSRTYQHVFAAPIAASKQRIPPSACTVKAPCLGRRPG
jgi:hypothetical protein